MSNRRKTLPPIDPSVDARLRPVLEALKEMQETGEGVRGDPLDRKLTVRDLVNAGLAKMRPGSLTDITAPDDDEDDGDSAGPIKIPPRPAEFNAVGGFGYVVLSWKIPKQQYLNHAYTEIWRSETDNLANAEMVGQEAGSLYTDYVRVDTTEPKGFYYWIKYVSTDDIEGPYNDTAGTYAEVIPDLDYLIGELSADIDNSKLAQSFLERLPGYQQTVSADGDVYSLTLNQNGYISGIGAYNDGTTSDFAVIADRFWIAPPNSTGKKKPFIVQDNNVYIDTAFIREASIQEGQIGLISFGKITDANGSPVTTVAGKLKGDLVEADNLRVASAAKFYGDNQSGNFLSGERGWRLRQTGEFEAQQAIIRGHLEAETGRISDSVIVGSGGNSMATLLDKTGRIDKWQKPGTTLIDGNKIFTGDAYVDTLQLKGQAVTIPSGVSTTSESSTSGTSYSRGSPSPWATALTLTIACTGNPVMLACTVDIKAYVDGASSQDGSVSGQARLLRGSTQIAITESRYIRLSGHRDTEVKLWSVVLKDAPGAGTVSYRLQVRATRSDDGWISALARGITALEVKR